MSDDHEWELPDKAKKILSEMSCQYRNEYQNECKFVFEEEPVWKLFRPVWKRDGTLIKSRSAMCETCGLRQYHEEKDEE